MKVYSRRDSEVRTVEKERRRYRLERKEEDGWSAEPFGRESNFYRSVEKQ